MIVRSLCQTAVLTLATSACSSSEGESSSVPEAQTAVLAPAVVTPSFDCAGADSEATKLVCSDAELAAMDNEVSRLYKLAENGPHMTPERKSELTAYQRGWIKGRDECWKASDKRQCVMTSYAQRIHELRQGYADARSDDANGASLGPLALTCQGLDFGIGVTFIQTDPGAAYLEWKDTGIALDHVRSGSGARYEGTWDGAKASLYMKGNDALLTMPGEAEVSCKFEEIG